MNYPTLKLKKDRDGNVFFQHPWIFSGALETIPHDLENGTLVRIENDEGYARGVGTFSNASSIAVRMFEFKDTEIDEAWWLQKITAADAQRKLLGYGPKTQTTGYRILFAEADGVPGLVVDRFDDVLVLQISTAGMENMKEWILSALKKVFKPRAIVERSDMLVRREEKLPEFVGVLHGKMNEPVEFLENGIKFTADILNGQKTGFFTDQKDLRLLIEKFADGRKVLDAFSYSGAAGVYALRGGAKSVTFLDSSASALSLSENHAALNFPKKKKTIETIEADVFDFLGNGPAADRWDMIVIDPPALIKSKKDEESGKKAYHFLNRAALRALPSGGILVTSSCSHFLSEDDFVFILRRAAVQAGVKLHILGSAHQSADHPDSVTFPEARYLKSFIALIEK